DPHGMRRVNRQERAVRWRGVGQEHSIRAVNIPAGYPSWGLRYTGLAGQCNRWMNDRPDEVKYLSDFPLTLFRNHAYAYCSGNQWYRGDLPRQADHSADGAY